MLAAEIARVMSKTINNFICFYLADRGVGTEHGDERLLDRNSVNSFLSKFDIYFILVVFGKILKEFGNVLKSFAYER